MPDFAKKPQQYRVLKWKSYMEGNHTEYCCNRLFWLALPPQMKRLTLPRLVHGSWYQWKSDWLPAFADLPDEGILLWDEIAQEWRPILEVARERAESKTQFTYEGAYLFDGDKCIGMRTLRLVYDD